MNRLCIFLIRGCRPLLGGPAQCCFLVGCTQYAIIQLEEKNIIAAWLSIAQRLLKCNPFL